MFTGFLIQIKRNTLVDLFTWNGTMALWAGVKVLPSGFRTVMTGRSIDEGYTLR